MIPESQLDTLAGKTLHGADGHKIGKIVDVYESTDASEGTFVTVATGLFGGHASFVPLTEATASGDSVSVPYDKDLVKNAPRVATDDELTSEEEDRLYAHYALGSGTSPTSTTTSATAAGAAVGAAGGTRAAVGHDTSGPTTDDAMTRSEERLRVGTQQVEAGRARLRKRIVTETVSKTVPVSHEELRVVREPITGGAAVTGRELTEEEHEIVLRAETPVVTKETVAVERVRLATETVQEEVRVDEQIRKEQIEFEDDTDRTPRR